MKKRMMVLVLAVAALAVLPTYLQAQEMVSNVGNDGLEKTISFDVASFTDIRDKKLEDVMKKMPGISADAYDGAMSFSYNGMWINKIYVNGLDVLEGNYAPVYNMKPEDVERLEVTENHVDVKVMKGVQYSNNVAINVVLKQGAGSKWSGSVKGGLGFKPLLLNADMNAINIGNKLQTTMLLKADNTGLNFSGSLAGFGGWDFGDWGIPGNDNSSGINYTIKQFLDVQPSLAPLSGERVRFNRSGIFNLGSTLKLSGDYQLNFQLTYHTDRLTASSLDETTYYLPGSDQVVDVKGENAKSKQHDIQADLTLLANAESHYLRNKLHFAIRWNDVDKTITGTFPNRQYTNTTPLSVTNNFIYKRHLGKNILTLNASAGFHNRPQDLDVSMNNLPFLQTIKANSAYAELSASINNKLSNQLTLSFNAGASGNLRKMDMQIKGLNEANIPNIDSQLNVFNAFGSATFTYINENLQATLDFPIKYGHYSLSDKVTDTDQTKSKLYLSPSLQAKYQANDRFALTLEAFYKQAEVQRMNLYPSIILKDFRNASRGLPDIKSNSNLSVNLGGTYMNPNNNVFINASLGYYYTKQSLVPVMEIADAGFIISGYRTGNSSDNFWNAMGDISKGIRSLKGKIGLKVSGSYGKSTMDLNGIEVPYTNTELTVSPYINGRLTSWWSVNYTLAFNTNRMKMDNEATSSKSKSYNQTLEMVFNPWKKLNFSILGEHYYTEFMDNASKHLILWDAKAEYNLSSNLQLILSVKNLLNQKTYNYTLVNNEMFTKSYTSYEIRPRNILLSLYYKF